MIFFGRACNAGYYRVTGINRCDPCLTGTYKTGVGNEACTACTNSASNKYFLQRTSGVASLNDCPWDCNAGYKKNPLGTDCTACTAGTYRSASQNRLTDQGSSNTCLTCTACTGTTPGTYLTRACTATLDTGCTSCSTACQPGFYKARPCNVSADLACERCATRCPSGKRLSGASCSGDQTFDNVLDKCVVCATLASCTQAGFYLTFECQGNELVSNECRQCSSTVTPACTADYYLGGCGGLSDTRCLPYTSCPTGQYLQDETTTKDGKCVSCSTCPQGTTSMRPCSKYLDAICRGKSCGRNDNCPRLTPQNKSAYFCSNELNYCGVCPPGYDSDGQYCLECPRGSTCDRIGQVACRGQCPAGVLSQCETFQGLGYAKCNTPCTLDTSNPTRIPWRGSYALAGVEDCATYFLCQPGSYKYFSTGGSVECRACTNARPTSGQLERWLTDGLSVADPTSCLWECNPQVARNNGGACVARYAVSNQPATNAAGSWSGGACGEGKTSEARSAVEVSECLACKPLAAETMQWVPRSEECAWECKRSDDLRLGGECVARRRNCAGPGWVQMTDGTCTSMAYPWNRPGYSKLKPGWGAPVVQTNRVPPADAQAVVLASLGYGWTNRHSVTAPGRLARLVEGALCSAARAWMGGSEYVFAAPCNRSFLVYLNLSAGTGGLGLLIGNGTLGWADGFRTQALFESELYVASGGNGTLYVLDRWNCLLREVVVWDRPGSYLTRVYTLWGNTEKLGLIPPQPKCYGAGALAWPRRFWPLRDGWLAFADEDGLWQFHTATRELLLMMREADGSFEADALAGVDAQTDVFTLRLYFAGGILWEISAAQAACPTDYTSLAGGDCSIECRWKDLAGTPAQYVDAAGLCRQCTNVLSCTIGQEAVPCTARLDGFCRACPSLNGKQISVVNLKYPGIYFTNLAVYTVAGTCDESTLKPSPVMPVYGWYANPTKKWSEPCQHYTMTVSFYAVRVEQCKCYTGLTLVDGRCVSTDLYAYENACAVGGCKVPRNARTTDAVTCKWECNSGYYHDTQAGFNDKCRACLTRETFEAENIGTVARWESRGDNDSPFSCESGYGNYISAYVN